MQGIVAAGLLVTGLFGGALQAPATPPLPSQTFWVAVDGRPNNDGSRERPLDLATALSSEGPVRPGATIWLRGGVYRGYFSSSLNGTPDHPIVVRQVPGERAIIDSAGSGKDALSVGGRDTWFWGFEITSSDPQRHSKEEGSWPTDLRRGYGAVTRAPGIRFINLIVHDNANGLGVWAESVGSDVYGSVIYNNGWEARDRAHGHGIYTQNEQGIRRLADNIVFNQFSHGIHAYGSEQARLDNIALEGNIAFNNGALSSEREYVRNLLVGGGRVALNPKLFENLTYFNTVKASGENNVGHGGGCLNLWAHGNYLIGGRPLVMRNCTIQSVAGNTFYGERDNGREYRRNEYLTAAPTGTRVFVRPNRCERGRAHIAIYNWDEQPEVSVDLSEASLVKGQRFEVRDVQNYFGNPVAEGIYEKEPVRIPMRGLRTAPATGDVASAVHTAPRFGAFVIIQPSVVEESGTTIPVSCSPADAASAISPLRSLLNSLGI